MKIQKLTTEEFKRRIYEKYGNRFEVVSEYVNNITKIQLKCNICGNIIEKSPSKMMGKAHDGCYICSGKNKHKTTISFKKELEQKYPNTFEVLGEYKNARTPLLVRRLNCGHEHLISPDNLLRGKGCPYCTIRQSSYMNKTEEYFDKNHISYIKEKRFKDCKDKRSLPFDYYLSDYNCCVEVDGEFHYEQFYNGTGWANNYNSVQSRDEIKNKYCDDNNIKLIRLPYYVFKTGEYINILNKTLNANTEVSN